MIRALLAVAIASQAIMITAILAPYELTRLHHLIVYVGLFNISFGAFFLGQLIETRR